MTVKPIGIRKDRVWLMPTVILVVFLILVGTIVSWVLYADEFRYEYLLENGVEVQATVIGYDYHQASNGVDGDSTDTSSGWYYFWECYYNGKIYGGTSGNNYFRTEEQVAERVGNKFIVTVDPNSNWVVAKPKSAIHADGFHYTEYLTCAIVFTCLLPLVILVSVKFAIYPIALNYKIDRSGKLPKEGEVIKIRSFIINYIKVKYFAENGEIKEKWSYAWFTKREAKFLQEKIIITIVPYKDTYGIVEEMQIIKN